MGVPCREVATLRRPWPNGLLRILLISRNHVGQSVPAWRHTCPRVERAGVVQIRLAGVVHALVAPLAVIYTNYLRSHMGVCVCVRAGQLREADLLIPSAVAGGVHHQARRGPPPTSSSSSSSNLKHYLSSMWHLQCSGKKKQRTHAVLQRWHRELRVIPLAWTMTKQAFSARWGCVWWTRQPVKVQINLCSAHTSVPTDQSM